MSTRVYNAYRLLPTTDLWALTREIQRLGTRAAHKVLLEKHKHFMGRVSVDGDYYKKAHEERLKSWEESLAKGFIDNIDIETMVKHQVALDIMIDGYKASTQSMARTGFDYSAEITFRNHSRYVYMQVFAEFPMRKIFNRWTRRPYMTDYHFQNSSDKPENISTREWKERERVWDELYETDIDRRTCLCLSVMDWREFDRWQWNFAMDFMKPFHKKVKAFEKEKAKSSCAQK